MLNRLLPFFMFAGFFGVIYVYIMVRHREKMYLMEHQLDRDEFGPRLFGGIFQTLKAAMLMIGLAVGLLVGYGLAEYHIIQDDIAYPSMVLLFGGLGLLLHYLIERGAFER